MEAIPLRVPFRRPFSFAAPSDSKREFVEILVVRLHTDAGIYGVGETQAWRRQGSHETLAGLYATIRDLFTPLLTGRSPFDVGPIMARLDAAASCNFYAQAAIGDALYDLMGKALGLPVHMLLGGRARERIPVGTALSISDDVAGMIEQAEAAYETGYRHLRIKIGLDPAADVANLERLRAHFGDRVVLRADANGTLDYSQALPFLRRLEAYDLDLVEQPLPGWDLDGMAALSASCSIPLSADESVSTGHSVIEIGRRRAAAAIQTKTGKNGGIHYVRKLWTIAQAAGIGIFPGNHPGTSISTAAVAHLCTAWSGSLLVGDFQASSTDVIASDLVTEPLKVRDGAIFAPDRPGLGIELDDDQIRRLRVDA